MSISAADIKLKLPERRTDFPDSGGRMTAAVVPDGQLNNVWPDVSSQDTVTGRFQPRKLFAHVDTPGTPTLAGAIAVLTDLPLNDAISAALFPTGDYFDELADIRNRIESYRVQAEETRYVLHSNHPAGASVVAVYCMPSAPTPDINDVFALSVEPADAVAPQAQFVRVAAAPTRQVNVEFVDAQGSFFRDLIFIPITDQLLRDFPGQEVTRRTDVKPATKVRATRVSDAARFYGSRRLVETAEIGATTIRVGSPYLQVVPANTQQTPIVNQLAGAGTASHVPSGPDASLTLSFSAAVPTGAGITRYLGMGFARGTLRITAGATALRDDGQGNIVGDDGPANGFGGSMDYGTGALRITHNAGVGSTSFSITAQPAATVIAQSYTDEIRITPNNQGSVYIRTMRPAPAPGTVIVEYRAAGQWIRLQDNGLGQLIGEPGQGGGTITYDAGGVGTVAITLGALPDLDSSVLIYWGTPRQTQRRDGDTEIAAPYITRTVAQPGIVPGTLEITYLVSGSPVTLTDDGQGAIITGASVVVGRVVYDTGETGFRPPTLPDNNSEVVYAYDRSDIVTGSLIASPGGGGAVSFNLGNASPIRPGSISIGFVARRNVNAGGGLIGEDTLLFRLRDLGDGTGRAGTRFMLDGGGGYIIFSATINYTTGDVTIAPDATLPQYVPTYTYSEGRWVVSGYTQIDTGFVLGASTNFSFGYQLDSADEVEQTESVPVPPVRLDLTPLVIDTVLPGSVRFTFKGRTYVDRGGSLVYGVSSTTNAGTSAGSMDYAAGEALITDWAPGGSNAVTVHSLLTSLREPGQASVFFRSAGSPLVPGQFDIRANRLSDGALITGTADLNGDITGAGVRGRVIWETGIVAAEFGELVTAAGNEAEPWYDPELVDGGMIWRPALVLPSSILYGAVVLRYIPVSSVLLGANQVRLPTDGRVLGYRPGYTLLLMHAIEDTVSPTPEEVVDLGVTELSEISVRDANGLPVLSTWYTLDLDAGTVTFADTLDLSAYELPLLIRGRVDERILCTGVQITGEIELARPTTRQFPAGESILAAALVLGEAYGSPDVQARYTNLFDQSTYQAGVWSNTLVGSPAAATYNDAVWPIEVSNEGTITERWAVRFLSGPSPGQSVEVIGERSGVIWTGTIADDIAPINPLTITDVDPVGKPYWRIDKDGWGLGWAAGNVLRFNTIGAQPAFWAIRCTQPTGVPEEPTDRVRLQIIGDAT